MSRCAAHSHTLTPWVNSSSERVPSPGPMQMQQAGVFPSLGPL
jgi:hypothetical protein